MKESNDKNKIKLGVLGLLTVFTLILEMIVFAIESKIYHKGFIEFNLNNLLIHFAVICFIWGTALFCLISYSKEKLNFNIFEFKSKPKFKQAVISFALLIVITFIMTMIYNGIFKPIAEFNGMIDRFGEAGIIAFAFQYVYYLFETAIIVFILAIGQKLGELTFKNKKLPWGGILLSITWGILHIISQNIAVGIFSILPSMLYGIVYLLMGKNIKYAYPLIYLMFVL